MENTKVVKTVRQSNGSLILTLTSELKQIGASAGTKVQVVTDETTVTICSLEESRR